MVKKVSKSVWVQARKLKIGMNMLIFENRFSGFLKNPDIFLRKCQKLHSKAEILHEWAFQ
jgi:hypothetical protein